MSTPHTPTELTLAAVRGGMVVTHRVFRRELPLMPPLIRAVTPGDTARAGVLAAHQRILLDLIRAHHEGENQFVWGVLEDRAPDDREIVDTMLRQHEDVARHAAAVTTALTRWQATAAEDRREDLAAAVDELSATLVAHADEEEADTLPLIAANLTGPEWGAFISFTTDAMPPDTRGTVMGMLIEDMPTQEKTAFLGMLPPPVSSAWEATGAAAYTAYTATIRQP